MRFSRAQLVQIAAEITALLDEFDRFNVVPDPKFSGIKLRVASHLCNLFSLTKAAGIRNDMLSLVRSQSPKTYVRMASLALAFDDVHEDNLKREAETEMSISKDTTDLIDRLSKGSSNPPIGDSE